MEATMGLMIVFIVIAGAIGGSANALVSENGFLFPKSEPTGSGATILRPGFIGNMFTGAIAAFVSWGLYGPLGDFIIAGTEEAMRSNPSPDKIGLTLASLVGAVLVGLGGARWLSNEVDKSLLRAAAVDAANKQPSTEASGRLALSTPAGALRVARSLRPGDGA